VTKTIKGYKHNELQLTEASYLEYTNQVKEIEKERLEFMESFL